MIYHVYYRRQVFICCHLKRDKRCGRCGPELLQQLRSETTGKVKIVSAMTAPAMMNVSAMIFGETSDQLLHHSISRLSPFT
jgi:hypothetical protein